MDGTGRWFILEQFGPIFRGELLVLGRVNVRQTSSMIFLATFSAFWLQKKTTYTTPCVIQLLSWHIPTKKRNKNNNTWKTHRVFSPPISFGGKTSLSKTQKELFIVPAYMAGNHEDDHTKLLRILFTPPTLKNQWIELAAQNTPREPGVKEGRFSYVCNTPTHTVSHTLKNGCSPWKFSNGEFRGYWVIHPKNKTSN